MNDLPAQSKIDELLDRAVRALNRGDRATADALAGQVLAVDGGNPDAEELLAAPGDHGEIRRLTILFADLVDSTALSTRIDVEVYRTVVGRYRDEVLEAVNRYEGHIGSTKGDGLLAVFGHPIAHENDAHRAVQAGLDITRQVRALSDQVRRRFGFDISVRVGIHRGFVYLDTAQDDVLGLGANLAARMCSLAEPGTVAVSEAIERVVRDSFDMEALVPKTVKGVDEEIVHFRVLGERDVATSTRGPLVGRERERAFLEQCWGEASVGTLATRGIAFQGEGGIGKTRLAYAAVDMAAQSGAVVLGLFGSVFHTDVGLRPVRRLLERRCGIRRDSDPADRLRRLQAEVEAHALDPDAVVPLLAPVLGIDPDSGYEPAHASGVKLYGQIATAIHDYLLACLGSGPGLVLVDDMHWFDEDTVDVVQALLREDRPDLLVVITGRQLPPLDGTTQTFALNPLSDADTDKLVLELYPQVRPDARNAVQERCDGIPLYIEEVVAKLKEQPSDFGQSPQVPDTLYETLFARLRPSANALPVVEAAALIGSRFDRSLLASVVDLDRREIDDVLEELTRGRVLAPVDNESWRFHHELLREVAAEVSPPTVRRNLHSRIADALVAAAADTPEWSLVARHYASAERYDEAATAHQRASADARRRGALNEARAHLKRALESIESCAPSRVRDRREIAVRLEAGFLASAAQGHASAEAAAEFERCLALIGPEPNPELYATLNALWVYYTARGDLRRGTQLAETLKAKLADVPGFERGTATTMGILAGFQGDFRTARDELERAAADVQDVSTTEDRTYYGPNDPIGGMYSFLAFVRFMQGDLTAAETALKQMEERSRVTGFPHGAFSLCYGRSIEALIRTEAGDVERGAELATELGSLAKQFDFDEWVMVAWSEESAGRALAVLAAGETDPDALAPHIQTLTTVVQTWRAFEVKTFLAFYDGVLARLLAAAGDHEAAREHLDVALKMGQDTLIQFYDAELMRLRAHTFTDADERHRQLRTAVDLAQVQNARIFELRAAADDFELVGEPARAALVDALRRLPDGQSWPDLARARALLR